LPGSSRGDHGCELDPEEWDEGWMGTREYLDMGFGGAAEGLQDPGRVVVAC
jgi:hypothetical protein